MFFRISRRIFLLLIIFSKKKRKLQFFPKEFFVMVFDRFNGELEFCGKLQSSSVLPGGGRG
jgi:hypothetical protein